MHCYDAPANLRQLVRNKVAHELPGRAAARSAQRAICDSAVTALRESRADALLVIKADLLGERWWQAVAEARVPTVLWLYDELTRMDYSLETLREIGPIVSYSPRDVARLRAEGIAATYLPDGFDSLAEFVARPTGAATFVGARYPGRERLMRRLAAAGIPVKAYGREWSRRPWDIVRTRRFASPGIPAGPDLPRNDYYGVMAGSLAALNIHGDDHDGFTMRTFEAPGVGGLHLVDRPDVDRYYDVGTETLVFTSPEELVDHVARAQREPQWAGAIREAGRARTLAEHTLVHRMGTVEAQWH
ncbi:CgeB family protein [Cryobacterium sp. 1639]|uniref:CgeB family protein n=1 Tax=Cryobacterium inferilacus TaxID=2866629 RepID=UPI0027E2D70B|nr:glycosyltransferase [Cryobacterium sp. 1639]